MVVTRTRSIARTPRLKQGDYDTRSIIVCPVGKDPAAKTANLEPKAEANWNPLYGMAKADVDAEEPMDGLAKKKKDMLV